MVTLFLLILAGFVLLIAGADFIVKSSVAMANKLKIPPLIVGLTVVAFGTSAPEFVVSLTSALEGAEGLVLPGLRKTAPRSDRDFRHGRDTGSEVPAQRKENSVIRFPLQFIYIN